MNIPFFTNFFFTNYLFRLKFNTISFIKIFIQFFVYWRHHLLLINFKFFITCKNFHFLNFVILHYLFSSISPHLLFHYFFDHLTRHKVILKHLRSLELFVFQCTKSFFLHHIDFCKCCLAL